MLFGQIERSWLEGDLWSLCQTTIFLAHSKFGSEDDERRDIWATPNMSDAFGYWVNWNF